MAACGAPIVGWLAERLGFDSSGSSAGGDADADIKRARALGVSLERGASHIGSQLQPSPLRWPPPLLRCPACCCDMQIPLSSPHLPLRARTCVTQDAVVICTALPWALCCLLYSGLHVTYPRCDACALRELSLPVTLDAAVHQCPTRLQLFTAPSPCLCSPLQGPPPGAAHTAHTLRLCAFPARAAAPAL